MEGTCFIYESFTFIKMVMTFKLGCDEIQRKKYVDLTRKNNLNVLPNVKVYRIKVLLHEKN